MRDELSRQQHQIALYYLYTPRPLPQELLSQHIQYQNDLCAAFSLHGRIRVSCEGINGVLSGRTIDLHQYEERLHNELKRIFSHSNVEDNGGVGGNGDMSFDLDIKYCKLRPEIPAEQQLFDSLSVKQTREVVSLYEMKNEPAANKKGRRGGRQARKWRQRQRQSEQDQQQLQQENAQEQAVGSDQLSKEEQCNGEQSNQSSVIPSSPEDIDLKAYPPARHLSPEQWNEQLQSEAEGNAAVLLDARNVYESKVGHFAVPGVPTLLPNTRKYSSLPAVFDATSEQLAGKKVYMYCTGGVRCERASAYLQALADSDRWKGDKPVEIYQLKGGIQKYLEVYGSMNKGQNEEAAESDSKSGKVCLYKGRNFVFDPRRTDPVVGPGCAGKCLLCSVPHDDYDNGHAPCDNKEARCCRCRVLVLICNDCRSKMRCFGEAEAGDKPDLFCGPNGEECIDEGNNISVDII